MKLDTKVINVNIYISTMILTEPEDKLQQECRGSVGQSHCNISRI